MEQLQELLKGVASLFDVVTESGLSAALIVIAVILIIISLISAVGLMTSKPEEVGRATPIAFFSSLVFGVFFAVLSPVISWIKLDSSPIKTVSAKQSFENLGKNSRIDWLIRLIAYYPDKAAEKNRDIQAIQKLGGKDQLYTFVGSYDELRGYSVATAMQMLGGELQPGQDVTAVIFPRRHFYIYPANARGLLQVVENVDLQSQGRLPIQPEIVSLSPKARSNLEVDKRTDEIVGGSLPMWSWDGYSSYYHEFCDATQKLRCTNFAEKSQIGSITDDWNPLGFSTRQASTKPACPSSDNDICKVNTWSEAMQTYHEAFGARVFLVKNLNISDLHNPYLIHFTAPETQQIPDIGVNKPGGKR